MRLIVVVLFLIVSCAGWGQNLTRQSVPVVNSPNDEQAPVLSPNGKTMYFTVSGHAQNVGGKRDAGDVWISSLIGNEWSVPVNAGNILNDASYNAVAGISADGERIYLIGHYTSSGKVKTQGLAVSKKTSSGWSTPENIAIPYLINRSAILGGCVSKDESAFIFSAESYGTHGAEDIYVSFKNSSGKWSEPKNLGVGINTKLQELSPSLSDDTRVLYFATNGRGGYGSFDIFYSERLDDSWTNWTKPVTMGSGVNTNGRELYYRSYPSDGFAVYTSNLNSDGYSDIKIHYPSKASSDTLIAKLPPKANAIIDEVKAKNPPNEIKSIDSIVIKDNKNIVTVRGHVLNKKANDPILATIHFQSDSLYVTNANSNGGYVVLLPILKQYVIKVEASGYVGSLEKLDIGSELKDIEINFALQPIEVGTIVNLKNVLFQQSTSNLLPESSNELDMVADFMINNPKVAIELAGHTDNRGIHSHNMKLSQERVDKVKEYLVKKGIDPTRISGKGYGGTRPIAENDAEETRRLNRRVEFTIVKN